jgi:methanogen homoaconitase small subunit
MSRVWKFGTDVDTDQIVPGRYAPYMRPDADVGDAAFIEARPDFAASARPGDIIVAGENFGCGSSREYAVEALRRREVGAIVALSFARIFFRNALNLGIPLFVAPHIVSALNDGDEVTLDLANSQITASNNAYTLPELPFFAREILAAGGIVAYVRQHGRFPGEDASGGL